MGISSPRSLLGWAVGGGYVQGWMGGYPLDVDQRGWVPTYLPLTPSDGKRVVRIPLERILIFVILPRVVLFSIVLEE